MHFGMGMIVFLFGAELVKFCKKGLTRGEGVSKLYFVAAREACAEACRKGDRKAVPGSKRRREADLTVALNGGLTGQRGGGATRKKPLEKGVDFPKGE
jgi:hypothetical protein